MEYYYMNFLGNLHNFMCSWSTIVKADKLSEMIFFIEEDDQEVQPTFFEGKWP
jgi:hypothetical protein